MPHETALIATIAAGLGLAFLFGLIAVRLRLPALVGYLLAAIADLLAVRRIAVPGAIAQIAVATGLGALVSHLWGWSWGTGLVFGLSLSVASTVVLLRALEDR